MSVPNMLVSFFNCLRICAVFYKTVHIYPTDPVSRVTVQIKLHVRHFMTICLLFKNTPKSIVKQSIFRHPWVVI
jgi:hypothetical protein